MSINLFYNLSELLYYYMQERNSPLWTQLDRVYKILQKNNELEWLYIIYYRQRSSLGSYSFNHSYSVLLVFGTEVLASALFMAVILTVVYTKGLKGFSGIAIGGIVGLDIFFLSFISGASMNPARSLAPALLSASILTCGSTGQLHL
jgi:glycerol uptake facilitator-like aquaporin